MGYENPSSYTFINGEPILVSTFPGGELNVMVPEDMGDDIPFSCVLVSNAINAQAIMELVLTVNAIRQQVPNYGIDLMIPYLPYARQDRVMKVGEAHSLKAFADLINSLNVNSVGIVHPHSDVALPLINNSYEMKYNYSSEFADMVADHDVLIAPDAGASKEVFSLARRFGKDYAFANKIRDPKTGEIVKYDLIADPSVDLSGRRCLVIDDICDGGRTFIELAEAIDVAPQRPLELNLFVTHGIFSAGFDKLKDHFNLISSTNSYLNKFMSDDQIFKGMMNFNILDYKEHNNGYFAAIRD